MEKEKQSQAPDSAESKGADTEEQAKPKKSLWRIFAKWAMWIVLTPIALLLLCIVLLYLPPVQRWAVDKASEWLSEEMEMQVSVEKVGLSFPLDLEMGGVLAVQEGDTVLNMETLDLSIELMPLFAGMVEIDHITMENTQVNTRNIIEAALIKGHIGEFTMNSHGIDLSASTVKLNHAALRDADLYVALADSVPEDTTQEEPSAWKVSLDDVLLERVKLRCLLSPQSDSTEVGADIGRARLTGSLDLADELYAFNNIEASGTTLSYDVGRGAPANGFDPDHIRLENFNTDISAVTNAGTGDIRVNIRQMSGRERSGLEISRITAEILMDTLSINVKEMDLLTPHSTAKLTCMMDFDAFEIGQLDNSNQNAKSSSNNSPSLGEAGRGLPSFALSLDARLGRGDLMIFTADAMPEFWKVWPAGQMAVNLQTEGNLEKIVISRANASMDGHFDIKSKISIIDPMEEWGEMKLTAEANSVLENIDFVKGFMPASSRNSFRIPHGIRSKIAAVMHGDRIGIDTKTSVNESRLDLAATYNGANDAYTADATMRNLNINQFVPMDDLISLTGTIELDGKGFDFTHPGAVANANMEFSDAHYGIYNLSNSNANLTLQNGELYVAADFDNNQICTNFTLDGTLDREALKASLDFDLPFIDFRSMGLMEEDVYLTTKGVIDVWTDMDSEYEVDADISHLLIRQGEEEIKTETISLTAVTHADTTHARISTGDLSFDFHAQTGLFDLLGQVDRFSAEAMKGLETRTLNIDYLRTLMPTLTLHAEAGRRNPISRILAVEGIRFDELKANLQTDTITGLQGNAHLYSLLTESMQIDSISTWMKQDAERFTFNAAVRALPQNEVPGFGAYLDGHVSLTDLSARLKLLDGKQRTGVDLGLNAIIQDSTLNISLFPDEPIIGFTRFRLNEGGFIRLEKKNRAFANLSLTSLEDSCNIAITANPTDSLLQDARVVVNNLNMEKLLSVLPDLPDVSGMLNIDANYLQDQHKFWVRGMANVQDLTYDDIEMGNVKAVFDYDPVGLTLHDIKARLFTDETEVAFVSGTYNTEDDGTLKATVDLSGLPLSLTTPFIPDQIVTFDGTLGGKLDIVSSASGFNINGELVPNNMLMNSAMYSLNMKFADDPIAIENSRITFNRYNIYNNNPNIKVKDVTPLTLNGWVDFANLDLIEMSLSIYGKNFPFIDAPRTRKSVVFGKMYGDFFARVTGNTNNMRIRGLVNLLNNTDLTYVMADTPLSIDDRLDDIVTFIDFNAPPNIDIEREKQTFLGIDMHMTLQVQNGAEFRCEFSADRQSYVNVQGEGSIIMNYTPEGVLSLQGRYTINDGEMKYQLPVIPLKTLDIEPGSYIEFTGEPANPTINFGATETTRATVSESDGSSRSVNFKAGLRVTGTLETMKLAFTIDAPEDMSVKNELASMSSEEKNKLAVGLLCTGMYLASSNSSGFNANNALNNFLQSEINNIASKALETTVDVNVGMEQSTRDDGSTRTDYSFKFSKRFFSNRLNVIIGGKVNADGNTYQNEAGAYIDNVSLEYRLDDGGTRYVRLYHEKNYDNLVEGELIENGASILIRKKFDRLSDLIIWKRKKEKNEE